MEIKPIRSEEDYEAALNEIDAIFDAEPGTPEGDRLEVLTILVEAYENDHYAIPAPDPIEAIEFHMERLGLTKRDLEQFIGSRSRVWEILNRKRPLTLEMVRKLNEGLGIPGDTLLRRYALDLQGSETERELPNTLGWLLPMLLKTDAGLEATGEAFSLIRKIEIEALSNNDAIDIGNAVFPLRGRAYLSAYSADVRQ